MTKELRGTRRVYAARESGLDVTIDITVNTNPKLAKLLGYSPNAAYMFADVCMTDKHGRSTLYTPDNKTDILDVLGWEDAGTRLKVVQLHAYETEADIDAFARRIFAAV